MNSKAPTKLYKIGGMNILGTTDDFRESPVEAVSGGFEAIMERNARGIRRRRAKNPIEPMRNRFDRMKSYYFKRGMDWNLTLMTFCVFGRRPQTSGMRIREGLYLQRSMQTEGVSLE